MTERVVEVPWMLANLPQSGTVLDVGSCEATYLEAIPQADRVLHCLDSRPLESSLPRGAQFFQQSLFGNTLKQRAYDCVVLLSTLEHLGLPCYGQDFVPGGDALALAEAARLLKPGGRLLATLPAGRSRMTTWYRQYSPDDLERLFARWCIETTFWGCIDGRFEEIDRGQVEHFSYVDPGRTISPSAGAVAAVVAEPVLARELRDRVAVSELR